MWQHSGKINEELDYNVRSSMKNMYSSLMVRYKVWSLNPETFIYDEVIDTMS